MRDDAAGADVPAGTIGHRRLLTVLRAVAVAVAVVLALPVDQVWPQSDLDPSWRLGLTWALVHGWDFGREVVFTYGPWGFLDHPSMLSPWRTAVALVLTTAACVLLWWRVERLLRSLGPVLATVGAAVVAACAGRAWGFSGTVALGVLAYTLSVYFDDEEPPGWAAPVVAAVGALLLLCALSTGLLVPVLAAALAARTGGRCVLLSAATGGGAVIAWWLVAGQSLGAFPGWLLGSLRLASGYADAMSYDPLLLPRLTYLYVAVGLVLIALAIARAVVGFVGPSPDGTPRRRDRLQLVGGAVIVVVAVRWAIQTGTVRDDPGHAVRAALALAVLVIGFRWVRPIPMRLVAAAVPACISAVLLLPHLVPVLRIPPLQPWQDLASAMVDAEARDDLLDAARQRVQALVPLSPAMRERVDGRPVFMDPWEVSAVWAHGLEWSPVPVFQPYTAYTPELDRLNARDLVTGPPDRVVLRTVGAVDSRNQLWDSPAYNLALACRFTTVYYDGLFTLLEPTTPRCGKPREVAQMRVEAGERVDLPATAEDQLLTASFQPDSPSLGRRLETAAFHAFDPLMVTADLATFRLPTALAGGPLILRLPSTEPVWPGVQAHPGFSTVTFTRGGTLTLSVRRIS